MESLLLNTPKKVIPSIRLILYCIDSTLIASYKNYETHKFSFYQNSIMVPSTNNANPPPSQPKPFTIPTATQTTPTSTNKFMLHSSTVYTRDMCVQAQNYEVV